MTEQEAINELQANIDLPFGFTVSDEVSEMAIKALEKQIRKKIFHQGYEHEGKMIYQKGINGVPYDLCPNCKINLCTDGCFGRNKKRMEYCENCGQKLDWSESDE